MLNTLKKGFTLIELLVVITIIGILATGAVSLYTTQLQKARDTTRITDVSTLESAIVQSSSDTGYFPEADASTFSGAVSQYYSSVPTDPRTTLQCAGNTACDYIYTTDTNQSLYEVSTGFESQANVDNKANNDQGNDSARMEFGNKSLNTGHSGAISGSGISVVDTSNLVIRR